MSQQSVYDFQVTQSNGEKILLNQFKGKAILIVNTASECGFTPQYRGLQELFDKYKEQLVILAFPCNQFGKQEPGTQEQIQQFCELNFGVSFPLMSKVEVNGRSAHPLFVWLKQQLPGLMGTKDIKWNFTKFLISAEGQPLKRYAPKDEPKTLIADLVKWKIID